MGKRALVFWGGWDGHQPELVANRFKGILERAGFSVEILEGTEQLPDAAGLAALDLLVPVVTGGSMSGEVSGAIARAVAEGVGIAGCHGGMCDSFRNDTEWQFMTGGQWVSHPGGDGVEYTVNIRRGSSALVEGIEDFPVKSEHYYLHVDPAIEVLATTRFPLISYFHASNKPVDMPVVWTKYWGIGRVFYCSLGHHDDVFENSPSAEELMRRGMLWAAEGKAAAAAQGWTSEQYKNNAKMY
ncbi:MAG: ThuA domain-containing protein [Oscillospiraceae bacterium]|nr:ThuA domain-containing protein [Oscillospiraceae bacterium]